MWKGTPVDAARGVTRPSSFTCTTWCPRAATMPFAVGTAEVTSPATVIIRSTRGLAASIWVSRVSARSVLSWVTTAVSPGPHPGLK